MSDERAPAVRAHRRHDLLLTAVLVGIGLTPAWLLPPTLALPWLVLGALAAVPALWLSWHHAPWQPTPTAELDHITPHLGLRPEHRFCDLGAGDGRLVLRVAQQTGATCVGVEASPVPYLLARLRLALDRSDARAEVRFGDLYRADLDRYDVLYVWGTAYSVSTPHFAEHVIARLRPGARLVSYSHPVHGHTPSQVHQAGLRPLYVYDFEAKQSPDPAGS